jgi:hypothetical protein
MLTTKSRNAAAQEVEDPGTSSPATQGQGLSGDVVGEV